MSDELQCEQRGRVAILTLNRPERLNAFRAATARLLWTNLDRIAADSSVRVVVITGAGRAFCAGADLKSLSGDDGPLDSDWGSPRGMIDLPMRLRALPQPTISAVNGVAAGGGFGMAMATDFRIASENARFGAAQIKTARIADAGLTYFLPRMLGVEKALSLTLTGRFVSAREALALGLVSEVTAPEDLMERVLAFADELARGPRFAMQLSREAVYRGYESSLDDALQFEYDGLKSASTHPDVQEGTRAFIEKRDPHFA